EDAPVSSDRQGNGSAAYAAPGDCPANPFGTTPPGASERGVEATSISHRDDVELRAGACEGCAGKQRIAVHQPDGERAVDVLPEDVGLAIGVEIPGSDHVPSRAGV